ncbi:MAG: hypothetical protein KAX05_15550 [Bacteroidales bacterium]|nr:hypothetical protein [Bacteroidales bacterium]
MEKEFLQGLPITKIAKKYGVAYMSLYQHCQDHIPKRLAKAYQRQEITESQGLLDQLKTIGDYFMDIFERTSAEQHDVTAMKALDGKRQVIDSLIKAAVLLHEAGQADNEQQEYEQDQADREEASRRLAILTNAELEMWCALQSKLWFQRTDEIIPDTLHVALQSNAELISSIINDARSPAAAQYEKVYDAETEQTLRLPLRRNRDGSPKPRDRTANAPGDFDPITEKERREAGVKRKLSDEDLPDEEIQPFTRTKFPVKQEEKTTEKPTKEFNAATWKIGDPIPDNIASYTDSRGRQRLARPRLRGK